MKMHNKYYLAVRPTCHTLATHLHRNTDVISPHTHWRTTGWVLVTLWSKIYRIYKWSAPRGANEDDSATYRRTTLPQRR